MTVTRSAGHRAASALVLLVGGGGIAAAAWVSSGPALAIALVLFYVVAGVVAYVWAGKDTDMGAILRAGGDERQRGVDRDATAFSGLVMSISAIIGAIVSMARNGGDPGAYGVMCLVGGVAYAGSLVILRSRR